MAAWSEEQERAAFAVLERMHNAQPPVIDIADATDDWIRFEHYFDDEDRVCVRYAFGVPVDITRLRENEFGDIGRLRCAYDADAQTWVVVAVYAYGFWHNVAYAKTAHVSFITHKRDDQCAVGATLVSVAPRIVHALT